MMILARFSENLAKILFFLVTLHVDIVVVLLIEGIVLNQVKSSSVNKDGFVVMS